jgi:DNA-directed RNA polymerase specialized sigma24 family protein
MFLRRSRRAVLVHIDEAPDCASAMLPELTADVPCPERQCVDNDELNRLYRGIARLPSNLSGVLSDQIFQELSLVEIAERQDLSTSVVKARIHRARKMLSRTLNPRRVAMGATA